MVRSISHSKKQRVPDPPCGEKWLPAAISETAALPAQHFKMAGSVPHFEGEGVTEEKIPWR